MEQNSPFLSLSEQFKIITDTFPILIRVSDKNGLYRFFNAAWLKFAGVPIATVLDKSWADAIHADDRPRYLNAYQQALIARAEFLLEYRFKRPDGNYSWLLDNGTPRYTTDGVFEGYLISSTDVTLLPESDQVKKELILTEVLKKEQAYNEELAATNEELTAANEELTAINEELQQTQENLEVLNNELEERVISRTQALTDSKAETQSLNEELSATNEELAAANEELVTMNEDLSESRDHLQTTLDELIVAKEQVERSERLFRSIAVSIPGALITVIAPDQHILLLDGDLAKDLPLEQEDYEGRHVSEIDPERYKTLKPLYERLLSGEKFSVQQESGEGHTFIVHFVPLKNEQLRVYAGLIVALDITEIKAAEARSAMLAAIIESTDDAIISKTLDGVITSWNKGAERLFGYTAEEIIGEPILRLIPLDRQEEEPKILARLRKGERVEHFETKRVTKTGKTLDLSLTISPVRDKSGTIIGLSKIARDISERKQDELRKNDFIAMVSHELKTPLTSLTSLIQILQARLKASEDAFVPDALDKANLQAKKMTKMINGFLNISRLESGKINIDKQLFSLEDLIGEVIGETRLTAPGRQIAFEPENAITVDADRDKIGSVISNLISNAIKYSPKTSPIWVKSELVDGNAQVSIRDEGVGIREQDRTKLFKRYYRVENDQTQRVTGFGIGLYLSAEIIQRHNGKIWVESGSGAGSTFYFSLPLK